MSQGQPQRSQTDKEPVTYGDVFQVSGDLATKPIAPKDAAAAQAAENIALGQIQKGGPASIMQSAADINVKRGVFAAAQAARHHGGVSVKSEIDPSGHPVVTESVGGEVVGKFFAMGPAAEKVPPLAAGSAGPVTFGQALESAVRAVGDRPVDESDAAVIQAVETRATGRNETIHGGFASRAQSAAKENARIMAEDKRIRLRDVLAGVRSKLPADRAVTAKDAEAAVAAELRNRLETKTCSGGVAEAIAAAARMNQEQGK